MSSSRPLPATQQGGATTGEGDTGTAGDDSGDEGGDPNDGDGGDKGSKGGGEGEGVPGGNDGCTPVDVQCRAFLRDAVAGVYALTVHPPIPRPTGEVYLRVSAVGDDSLSTLVRVASARLSSNNRRVGVQAQNRIGPVQFARTGPLRLEVTLAEPRRLSLQVTAEEVPDNEAE